LWWGGLEHARQRKKKNGRNQRERERRESEREREKREREIGREGRGREREKEKDYWSQPLQRKIRKNSSPRKAQNTNITRGATNAPQEVNRMVAVVNSHCKVWKDRGQREPRPQKAQSDRQRAFPKKKQIHSNCTGVKRRLTKEPGPTKQNGGQKGDPQTRSTNTHRWTHPTLALSGHYSHCRFFHHHCSMTPHPHERCPSVRMHLPLDTRTVVSLPLQILSPSLLHDTAVTSEECPLNLHALATRHLSQHCPVTTPTADSAIITAP